MCGQKRSTKKNQKRLKIGLGFLLLHFLARSLNQLDTGCARTTADMHIKEKMPLFSYLPGVRGVVGVSVLMTAL